VQLGKGFWVCEEVIWLRVKTGRAWEEVLGGLGDLVHGIGAWGLGGLLGGCGGDLVQGEGGWRLGRGFECMKR
jgi:hypothetical protein